MARSWRECCDDVIIWLCSCTVCDSNGRYIGEELEGDWFPPTEPDPLIIRAEEGRNMAGENVRVDIPENRCSDPKLIEENAPNSTGSDTNAVYFGGASLGRRSPIECHNDLEV